MLMGDVSVKTIPTQDLTTMSLYEIAELVNSDVFDNGSRGSLSNSQIHRILNNRKSDLINNQTNLIIGTNALGQESTIFNNLGLIIIDEQHKFGV